MFIVPNPLISRNKPSFAGSGGSAAVHAGRHTPGSCWSVPAPSPEAPAWLALQVGVGPKRVLLSWTGSRAADYADASRGAPAIYLVETSADSSNGADGSWRVEASIHDNGVNARAHTFEFDGQSWVRLVVLQGAAAGSDVRIERLDVHDASDGTDDTWLVLGEDFGLGAVAGPTLAPPPSFAELIHGEYPGYFPALINGRIAGETCAAGGARIAAVLALNPGCRHFAISYGAEEASTRDVSPEQFRVQLSALIRVLVDAERVPVLARIPFDLNGQQTNVGSYNGVIDELTREHGLLSGPDLYAWFKAHPEQIAAAGRTSADGCLAVQRLWAEALDAMYVPQ
jgi:acyl-CoA thioesterase I